jgi:hypothetical protein
MNARFVMIAATVLTIGASATAEPPKTPAAGPAHPPSPPAEVLLASADQVSTPASPDQGAAPVKRPRVARVTTCRCGDQQIQNEQ